MLESSMRLLFMPQDNKFWRIDWFGDICYPDYAIRRSMPSISLTLSSWYGGDEPENFHTNRTHHTQVYAPVGFLGKLRIGDVWQNGKLAVIPEYVQENFPDVIINRKSSFIIKSGLSTQTGDHDVFYLPLQQHPYHAPHTQSYCLKVDHPSNKRLIIPAVELIRFYFGSSGGLLSHLFRFPLMPDRLWVAASRSAVRKKANITLSQGLSGWSAADIARIAFDPVAWHAAQLVGNSLSVAKINRLPLYPKAHFPFDGKTTLRASGVWLPFGDDPAGTFLVYRLLSCSHRFPFRGLEYRLAGRTGLMGAAPKEAASEKMECPSIHDDIYPQSIPVPAKRTSKNLVEEDPSKNLDTAELVIDKESQFPDLQFKSVRRVAESVSTEIQAHLSPVKPVSAASVGSDGMNGSIRPVDLVRRSEWGKSVIEPHLLMHALVAELSASAKFDKVEMIRFKSEEEDSILTSFGEALWRYKGEPLNRSNRMRRPVLSNIQIATATKGNAIAFLLIAETNRVSKLSPFCVVVKPHIFKKSLTIVEDIVGALNLPKDHFPEKMTDYDISPHLIPVPGMSLKRDISEMVLCLSHQVRLYCEVFMDS